MHPHHRLTWSLLGSLALWAPTFRSTVGGDIDVLAATFRWVAAFVVATIAVSLLASLLQSYRPASAATTEPEQPPSF